jgi:hypothetical protein
VAEVVTMAGFVKLIETLEEDIEDSVEIVISRVDSLLIYIKRSAMYIKKKGVSLIDILKKREIELITNLREC